MNSITSQHTCEKQSTPFLPSLLCSLLAKTLRVVGTLQVTSLREVRALDLLLSFVFWIKFLQNSVWTLTKSAVSDAVRCILPLHVAAQAKTTRTTETWRQWRGSRDEPKV